MEFMEVIKARRSIRKFKSTPVSDENITQLLEAARLAPSGSNLQPWRFVIVKSPEIKEKLRHTTPYKFAVSAPVLLACCVNLKASDKKNNRIMELLKNGIFDDVEIGDLSSYNKEKTGEVLKGYLVMNVAIAIQNMILRAVELGLSTCWIGGFDSEEAHKILDLEAHLAVVALLPVGYPDQSPSPRPRLTLEELIIKTI